jgi:hypothetical protein
MNDTLFMRRFQGFGDLAANRHSFIKWNRPLRDAVGQRRAFDEFHDECEDAVGFFEAVDDRDVGMIQRREGFGFAFEAR